MEIVHRYLSSGVSSHIIGNVTGVCPSEHGESCVEHCHEVCFQDELYDYVDPCCDCSEICSLTPFRKVLAIIILLVALLLLAKRRWDYFPVGRAMGVGFCATVTVVFVEIAPPEMLMNLPSVIDMNTLGVLFGLTIISGYMMEFGMIDSLIVLMKFKCNSAFDLLFRSMIMSTMISATLTNDAAVIILTEPIVKMALELGYAPMPFLIALAASANTGSTLTLIGNPQNVLIATASKIPFAQFLLAMFVPVVVCLVLTWALLCMFYYETLSGVAPPIPSLCGGPKDVAINEGTVSSDVVPEEGQSSGGGGHGGHGSLPPAKDLTPEELEVQQRTTKIAGSVVFLALLLGFIFYHSITWCVMLGVLAMLLVEVYVVGGEGASVLRHVDGPLLIIIGSLFIVVGGAQMTGLPDALYNSFTESVPNFDTADLNTWSSLAAFVALIVVLSTLCGGNVPAVMLLAEILQDRHAGNKEWYLLAFASTVAGNLTLVASIANLIVAEKSAYVPGGVELTFFEHLKFNWWSTILIVTVGSSIIYVMF